MPVPFYKFLDSAARTPFVGFAWPQPHAGHGGWVVPGHPAADSTDGSRVCRVEQLPHWIADELWVVETDGRVQERGVETVAERVRLVGRVEGWHAATARDWAAAAAWRARDDVAARLVDQGHPDGAAELRAGVTLSGLATRAYAVSVGPGLPPALADAVGVLAELGYESEHARVATALLSSAVAIAGWDADRQAAERRWQARWLAARLGLAG
jgi:hypothetical protein